MIDDAPHIIQILLGILGAIVVGIYWDLRARIKGNHNVHAKNIGAVTVRVADLEKTSLSREEWDAYITRVTHERKEMHLENQNALKEMRNISETHLQRIEEKIDRNEEKAAKSRHDIRDNVHALALKLAVLEKRDSR